MSLDFRELLTAAVDNEQNAKKALHKTKTGIKTEFSTPAKRPVEKKKKGVESAAVRAFLEKQERDEKIKALQAKKKKVALLKARTDAKHNRKAHAMASRTKDNLKVFHDELENTSGSLSSKPPDADAKPSSSGRVDYDEDDELRIGSMFLKNKRRVAHKPEDKILQTRKPVPVVVKKPTNEDLWNVESDSDKETDLNKPLISVMPSKPKSSSHSHKESKHREHGKSGSNSSKANNHVHKTLNLPEGSKTQSRGVFKSLADRERELKESQFKSLEDREKERKERKAKKKEEERKEKEEAARRKEEKAQKKLKMKKELAKKRAAQAPPPMSFHQILALASGNRKKPMEEIEEKVIVKETPKHKKEEEKRPMTAEERERYDRRQTKEYQEWLKRGGRLPGAQKQRQEANQKYQSNNERNGVPSKGTQSHMGRPGDQNPPNHPSKSVVSKKPNTSELKQNNTATSKGSRNNELNSKKPDKTKMDNSVPHKKMMSNGASLSSSVSDKSRMSLNGKQSRGGAGSRKPVVSYKDEDRGSSSGIKSQHRSDNRREDEPTNPWDRIYSQVKKNNPKPAVKRRIVESDYDDEEDEYDSELDDFIADDDDNMDDFIDDTQGSDYSKHIKQIFGYDKNKYRNERDDDINDMETNYSQIMREEAQSARIGKQEDLEDMRMEEEERKQKLKLKCKQMSKKMRR